MGCGLKYSAKGRQDLPIGLRLVRKRVVRAPRKGLSDSQELTSDLVPTEGFYPSFYLPLPLYLLLKIIRLSPHSVPLGSCSLIDRITDYQTRAGSHASLFVVIFVQLNTVF